jgi:hypothetical protein
MNTVFIRRTILLLALAAPAAWPQSPTVELAGAEGTLIGGGDLNRSATPSASPRTRT